MRVIYHRSIDWTLAPSSRARPIAGGAAPGEHEKRIGEANANWPDWYADYIVCEQAGVELPSGAGR